MNQAVEQEMRQAMEETLTLLTREWIERWVRDNVPAILTLPVKEGNLLFQASLILGYKDCRLDAPRPLMLALRKLEHGTAQVPAVQILTKLQKYLEPYILSPDALQS